MLLVRRVILFVTSILILGIAMFSSSADASIITVTRTADSGAGTLRDAIARASSGDTIDFGLSYPATITLTTGELLIDKNLTIAGPGASGLTVSGNNASRVFSVRPGNIVAISGLTVTGGNSSLGGGIYNQGGAITAEDIVITGNSATYDGGGLFVSSGKTFLTDSTISKNDAMYGGGISAYEGTLTITNSTISENTGRYFGGGLYLSGNDIVVTISNSTIAGNMASIYGEGGDGGGIDIGGSDFRLTLINSSIIGNSPDGIDAVPCDIHCNTLCICGGGAVMISNSILAANDQGFNCSEYTAPHLWTRRIIVDQGPNLDDGNSCAFGSSSLSNTNPLLDPVGLKDNGGPTKTIALLPGSPAIDAGNNASCPATDQRGVSRPQGAVCDIGAYEIGPFYLLNITIIGKGRVVSDIIMVDPMGGEMCYEDCTILYTPDSPLQLIPFPSDGWRFAGWSGNCNGVNECWMTMSGHRKVTATFVEDKALIEATPLPITARSARAYDPVSEAGASILFENAYPIGIGPHAIGRDRIAVNTNMKAFAEDTDLYFVVRLPGNDPNSYYQLKADNTFQRVSEGLAPWKKGISGAIDENLFGFLSALTMPPGTYELYMMAAPTGKTDAYRLWETAFDIPFNSTMPLPNGGEHYKQQAAAFPARSIVPATANPIGLGSVAVDGKAMGLSSYSSMGGGIGLKVGLEGFEGPADIYFGIAVPDKEPNEIFVLNSDGVFKRLSQGLVIWKPGHSGPLNEVVMAPVAITSLPNGRYAFYLLATPQGRMDAWYLWESGITIP